MLLPKWGVDLGLGLFCLFALSLFQAAPADAASGGFVFTSAKQAVNAAQPAARSVVSMKWFKCPRCGELGLMNGVCKNCGPTAVEEPLIPRPAASSPPRIQSDIRSFTRGNQAINQSMREINNSVRDINRDISRIRNLNRRF